MHPNDSESFTGGIGGPSDPALVEGGQDREPDDLIRDGNIVGLVILALVGIGLVVLLGTYGPAWLVANSALVLLTPLESNWPRCSTPGCDRYALTDDLCRDCACEARELPETVEVVS